jgi:hypothetical protein
MRRGRSVIEILRVESGVVWYRLIPGPGYQDVASLEPEFRKTYRLVPGVIADKTVDFSGLDADDSDDESTPAPPKPPAPLPPPTQQPHKYSEPWWGGFLAGYVGVGLVVGWLSAVVTFIAVYVFAVSSVGWVIGLALGWIPAGIAAAIVGWLVGALWPVLAVAVAFVIYKLVIAS